MLITRITRDSHRLFVFVCVLFFPLGGAAFLLILAPALLAANGQWADAAADEMFHFAQETVGAERAARVDVA